MTTEEKLNQLANYRAQLDVLNLQKQDAINGVLTPEIKAALDEIEAEFGQMSEGANGNIAALEAEIKEAVTAHGETVKSEFLMAVYNKPRVSWDTKGLDGYAVAHPEVKAFQSFGKPSVSIRSR
jgi:hypothetical protein